MSLTKKIVIAIGILLLLVIGYVSYIMFTSLSKSPFAVEKYQQSGVSLQVEYCRPFKRERLIFGTPEEEALLPYGKYWRLGANDATKLIVGTPVDFGGLPLQSGSYSLYAFPEPTHWVIGVNSEYDRSGSNPPDFSKDLGRIKIPVENTPNSLEQFTITLDESATNPQMVMQWDQVRVIIPIKPTE